MKIWKVGIFEITPVYPTNQYKSERNYVSQKKY
jgi:hypothetical protein